MSELNKAAQDYLDSLGLEIPHVEDAAPKTFDTQDRRNKVVPQPNPQFRPYSRQVTVTRAIPASAAIADRHIRDYKLEQRSAEEYKDAREMWDAINFQPLPIAAEEVVAPPAWRVWPTGSEVRVALMIVVFVLLGIVFLVTR